MLCLACRSTATSKPLPEAAQLDGDMHSNSSFNEERSQATSVEHASEIEIQEMQQLLDTAEERMSQAEQRAMKAEESAQVDPWFLCFCNHRHPTEL